MKQNLQKAFATSFIAACLLLAAFGQTRAQTIINAFSGNSVSAFSGDNGQCNLAELWSPFGIGTDKLGNVYIADGGNNRIRKVDAITGIITTIAGNGTRGFAGDGGLAINAEFNNPQGVAVDTAGNIYIADTYNYVARKITKSTGIITTIAGTPGTEYPSSGDGGPATSAVISLLIGIAVDDSGNVFIADHYSSRIREVSSVTGKIRNVAGGGSNPGTDGVGDGGPGSGASFNQPDAIALDGSGNVYVADASNYIVRKIMAKSDSVFLVAGTANSSGYTGDGGLATAAQLSVCYGVAVDGQGNVYITDSYNNVIRKVTKSTGIITTIAGDGNANYAGDGGPALSAEINTPCAVAVDKCNNVYSIDNAANDNRVRIIYIPDSVKSTPNPATICNGSSTNLTAAGATYYTWSPSAGLNNTSLAVVSANPVVSSTYVLKGGNGCAGGLTFVPATVVVKVGTSTPLSISPANPSVCPNQSVTLSVNGGGSSFKWSPSTALNKVTGDSVVATGFTLLDSIVYTVTDTSSSGCPAIGEVTLRSGGSSVGGHVNAVRDTICQNTPGNLSLSGNSSNNIQWQYSTDDINFTDAVNDTLAAYKTSPLTQSTWYRATVGAGSCSALSDTRKLFVPPALTAYFNVTQPVPNQLTFSSDSSVGSIRSYHWDFGDGQESTEKNPQHTYAKDSTYYVCLTLYDGSNCSYTFCRYSQVTDAVPNLSASGKWLVYPNPFSDVFFINGNELNRMVESVELYDMLGRLVWNNTYAAQSSNITINLSGFAQGMYYLEIKTAKANFFQPLIKQQ